jgi:Pentapeptide repeats (8 copies)
MPSACQIWPDIESPDIESCESMSKRFTALPRGVRWVAGGITAVVLALAIAWLLFVPIAGWLARHDVGSAKGLPLQTARDAARGRLLTLGAGLLAASALVFTARNFTLSREGQVTDRYTKAIEQVGSDKLDVRIGGIYALERIARDSARDHPTVMEVLTAFIREHSREPWPPSDPDRHDEERSTRPDVQAAITVVCRRDPECDIQLIYLNGADLTGAELHGAGLDSADLAHTDLCRADLSDADLSQAILLGADLTAADLSGADLTDANLSSAILDDAKWPEDVRVPEGWKRDADSGRLERTGRGPGSADAN